MQASILIVDDQDSIRRFLAQTLEDEDFEVRTAALGERALEICEQVLPDIVLLDLKLPDMDGIAVLEEIKKTAQEIIVIMITAHGDIRSAVEAMRLGAFDYVSKPLNVDQLIVTIHKAMDSHRLWMELSHWRRQNQKRADADLIIGESDIMRQVMSMTEQVARSNSTSVLIEGESGTGKELVAHAIHNLSPRRNGPFMDLNCASLPNELLESELFGHERGAFTDAKAMKKGLLELTDGGTLFLDEVGEMPLSIQAKLLRVLERMIFKRIGGTKDIRVDVRIISATNRDLNLALEQGLFREDLYYRLKVVPILIPPLRERGEDALILGKHFMHEFNSTFGKSFAGFAPEAEALLLQYSWPGNVRELRNTLERAILLGEGDLLTAQGLGIRPSQTARHSSLLEQLEQATCGQFPESGFDFEALLNKVEKEIILQASNQTAWNQTRTSLLLGMNRDKLRYRMKLHDIRKTKRGADHVPIPS
ncbi:MAG: sigma-54-dependent Fis family transcriptional regulator [Candidatus Eisenbacteria sp.]|nr:sigma-54-dependent Fis family transcriptional regulator [Candidatus Eisenbacteria bacterium]